MRLQLDPNVIQSDIPFGSLCASDSGFQSTLNRLTKELRSEKQVKGKQLNQTALLNTLIAEYHEALMMTQGNEGRMYPTTPDGDEKCSKSMTHRMVRDLVNRRSDEAGIMILIRQPEKTGAKIYDSIKKVRNSLGLQKRFAVLTDLDSKGGGSIERSMKEDDHIWFYEQLKARNGGKEPSLSKYSDLEGLPVILILCEKGKMGTCCFE